MLMVQCKTGPVSSPCQEEKSMRCLGLEVSIGESKCPDLEMEMRDAETGVRNQQRKKCSGGPESGLKAAERLLTAFNIHIQNLYVT